ncbi:hypothetical protein AV530_013293 [Patagioenas fasciata monilis]|uniref:Uncharacterized protein n=1 Tax=Patagioenas fasciata monilis TaxID=372326 RepID=A0A1V4JNV7_PATFA|nr:hypothetical protein AV530_013293 [Patagioenas fasciata monilis]
MGCCDQEKWNILSGSNGDYTSTDGYACQSGCEGNPPVNCARIPSWVYPGSEKEEEEAGISQRSCMFCSCSLLYKLTRS